MPFYSVNKLILYSLHLFYSLPPHFVGLQIVLSICASLMYFSLVHLHVHFAVKPHTLCVGLLSKLISHLLCSHGVLIGYHYSFLGPMQ